MPSEPPPPRTHRANWDTDPAAPVGAGRAAAGAGTAARPARRPVRLGAGVAVDYPEPQSARVTAVMRGNRKRDTKPELVLRHALFARGLRYRVDHPVRVGAVLVRPDVVFPRRKLAVFVDGCFWHGCPLHGTTPRANGAYWGPKIARNVARDRERSRLLEDEGWTVLRIWEHEPVPDGVARIERILRRSPV